MSDKERKVDVSIDIQAPVERVWQALTEAEHIRRWFASQAKVIPGKGGSIALSWEGDYFGEAEIEIWEPNRHLRTVTRQSPYGAEEAGSPDSPQAQPIVIDYLLESRGGKTTLRIVHAGFGEGPDWDEEFDGVRYGWAFEMRVLRHYLEQHYDQQRTLTWLRAPVEDAAEQVWDRMMTGLARGVPSRELQDGERLSLDTIAGERLEGKVTVYAPPRALGMVLDRYNGAVLRLAVERCAGTREANVWLETWGAKPAEVQDFRRRWTAALEKAFPGTKVKTVAAAA